MNRSRGGNHTRRRILASLLAAPWLAQGQDEVRAPLRTIGLLIPGPSTAPRLRARLAERGYVEGRSVRFEIRNVSANPSRAELDAAAAALVRAAPDLLFAQGADAVTALHRATARIPIVCGGVSNPIGLGLARSLAQPGGNVTGLSHGLPEAAALQMAALRSVRPQLKRVFFLIAEDAKDIAPDHVQAASALGLEVQAFTTKTVADAERVFAGIRDPATQAVWLGHMPASTPATHVAAVAIRSRVATHAMDLASVRAGHLMSFWLAHEDPFARIIALIEKVLRGANPAQIPFELPDRAQLFLNRATAAAIGVKLGEELLLRATEVVG